MKVFGVDLGLLWKLKKVRDEVDKATKSGFSWGTAFTKMAKDFLIVLGGLLAVHFSDPTNIAAFLGVLPENLQKVLIPLAASVAMLIQNWRKNRKNEMVMMVPVEPPIPNDRRSTPTPVAGATPIPISMKPATQGNNNG